MGDVRDILIYEDDLLTRTLLQEWLQEAGYRVRIGNRCNPHSDAPGDLVIVSVYRPKQDGEQCVRAIRNAHQETPMLAISAQFRSGVAAAGSTARLLGVGQVIAKPLIREGLLDSVRGIMR